ncbi:hypothetical protein TrRE_jg7296 [Triparma retinervis]|uniref:Uncharacterized protein n=1 Tax=Triparma retinervis TaxID=2557542 RepID=A0A9W6ZKE7_9STRA|nr:hypothetical protein TrRE_jg7296 [Triparma retinervis]
MSKISSFTDSDLLLLPSPRMRSLFLGARSASLSPSVVLAFAALYEDMKVLRLGGDMIFGYLTRQADKSREEIERQRRGIGEGVGRVVSEEEVKAGFSVFEGIDVNKDGEISREELEVRGEGVLEVFGEDFDEFMKALITAIEDSDGTVTIEEILLRNRECVGGEEGGRGEEELCVAFGEKELKFTAMLSQVAEWEESGVSASGRSGIILDGCYAGLKNEEVVEALRIVYTDYSALRLAGDLIFKLLKVAVGRKGE